mmetsp:Transcript_5943/g.9529  ORF Transcript_5943/g.9529 Transcript_5943/m.9529 type:complete len:84 (-) Transcript_5943:257-508(-)
MCLFAQSIEKHNSEDAQPAAQAVSEDIEVTGKVSDDKKGKGAEDVTIMHDIMRSGSGHYTAGEIERLLITLLIASGEAREIHC